MIRKIGDVQAAGIPYSVYEADASGDLEDNLGVCRFSKHQIFIREGLVEEAREDTIFHEVLHAVMNESGAKQFLKGTVPEGADIDAIEETLVQILTPHLRRAVGDMRLLLKPRRARG